MTKSRIDQNESLPHLVPFTYMLQHFTHTNHVEASHAYDRCEHDCTACTADDLAAELADFIVELRCRDLPGLYSSWCSKRDGGTHTTTHAEEKLRVFIGLGFGLPDENPIPADHLEGAVAESLWYALVHEFIHEDPLVYAVPPGLSASDHGSDGFVVHRRDGELAFRLWEIKKNTGESPIGSTIGRAYRQLNSKALEYLARLIPAEQHHPDPDVRGLITRSMEHWLNGDAQAAAGVAVACSSGRLGNESFSTMGTRFPSMTRPNRLRGFLAGLGDFADFARLVQAELWKGL